MMRGRTGFDDLRELHGDHIDVSNLKRIYADGTVITGDGLRGGDGFMIQEPPQDEVGRLQAVREYWAVKLQRAEDSFYQYHQKCLQDLNHCLQHPFEAQPPQDAEERLRNGKALVEELRAKIIEIDIDIDAAQFASLTPKQAEHLRQQQAWERDRGNQEALARQHAAQRHSEIEKITI